MEYSPPRRSKYARPQERESDFLAEEEAGLTRRSRRAQSSGPLTRTKSQPAPADNSKRSARKTSEKELEGSSLRRMSTARRADVSGENGLLEFLEDYKRVSFEEACMGRITHNQIAVWVHVNGVWVRDFHNTLGSYMESPIGSESWCRFYLRKTLDVSRKDYAEAKKGCLVALVVKI